MKTKFTLVRWWMVAAILAMGGLGCGTALAQQVSEYQAMQLQVPFLPQVPPGDWTNTKNCGQACSAMAAGYYKRFSPATSMITAENSFLATKLKDTRYNAANGYYTHFNDGKNSLGVLIRDYHGLNYSTVNGGDITSILYQLRMGRPVIVGVKISGGRLVSSGGVAHWALAVGWNARDKKLILHDPGTNSGRFIQYAISDFDKSWATQGRIYAPVMTR